MLNDTCFEITEEVVAAWIDGMLPQSEELSFMNALSSDSSLGEILDAMEDVDDNLEAVTDQDFDLPEEFYDDFELPVINIGNDLFPADDLNADLFDDDDVSHDFSDDGFDVSTQFNPMVDKSSEYSLEDGNTVLFDNGTDSDYSSDKNSAGDVEDDDNDMESEHLMDIF